MTFCVKGGLQPSKEELIVLNCARSINPVQNDWMMMIMMMMMMMTLFQDRVYLHWGELLSPQTEVVLTNLLPTTLYKVHFSENSFISYRCLMQHIIHTVHKILQYISFIVYSHKIHTVHRL